MCCPIAGRSLKTRLGFDSEDDRGDLAGDEASSDLIPSDSSSFVGESTGRDLRAAIKLLSHIRARYAAVDFVY